MRMNQGEMFNVMDRYRDMLLPMESDPIGLPIPWSPGNDGPFDFDGYNGLSIAFVQ